MSKTELIFTDEELERVADKVVDKLCLYGNMLCSRDLLKYGLVAKYKNCTIHFDMDSKSRDMFLIKDNNGNVIGRFIEVVHTCDLCER